MLASLDQLGEDVSAMFELETVHVTEIAVSSHSEMLCATKSRSLAVGALSFVKTNNSQAIKLV